MQRSVPAAGEFRDGIYWLRGDAMRQADVLAAAVVAKPDPKWGEVPCAFIELRDGASPTSEELTEHCRAHLARFKAAHPSPQPRFCARNKS